MHDLCPYPPLFWDIGADKQTAKRVHGRKEQLMDALDKEIPKPGASTPLQIVGRTSAEVPPASNAPRSI